MLKIQSEFKAKKSLQPSLMNFCVTDGESVVVTRYISSKMDEAASLVGLAIIIAEFLLKFFTHSGFHLGRRLVSMPKVATTRCRKPINERAS